MKILKKEQILHIIQAEKVLKVATLEKKVKLPRSTLLRYLRELENSGYIVKTFGEVSVRKSHLESPAQGRLESHRKQKTQIAQHALQTIKEGEIIFVDAGSTTFHFLKLLRDKKLIIFTNSLLVANFMTSEFVPEIYLIPGKINKKTLAVASSRSVDTLTSLSFDKSYLGFNSLINGLYSTTNEPESIIKKIVIKQTKTNSYVLGRKNKSTKKAHFAFCHEKDVVAITEKGIQ